MPYHHQEEKKEKLLEKEIKNYNTTVETERLKNWEEDINARLLELNSRQKRMEEEMRKKEEELKNKEEDLIKKQAELLKNGKVDEKNMNL